MKKENYCCDCGTLMVHCNGNYIQYDNGIGDGSFNVYVFDDEIEFKSFLKQTLNETLTNFISCAYFDKVQIMSYDVPYLSHPILELKNGRYGIYNNDGDVYFVKWETWKEDYEEEGEEE